MDATVAITETLRTLFTPGEVFEIRIPDGGVNGTISGYFDDAGRAAQAVAKYDGQVPGIYVTLNPLPRELLGRANNRLKTRVKTTTSDHDVLTCRWLLVDADPERPAGISSSNEEHAAALARIRRAVAGLTEDGWPEPLLADSGNGWHALFPIDMLAGDLTARVLEKLLKSLAGRFNDPPDASPRITLDTGVFNASRITKLYGTRACKGDATPERPHRRSRLVNVPTALRCAEAEEVAQ